MHLFVSVSLNHVGPPLAPSYTLTQEHAVDSFIHHTLQWTAPFTWSEFPIINYTVVVYDYCTGDLHEITKQNTQYMHTVITEGRRCHELDFSVAANSRAGRSEAVITHTGHPIGKVYSDIYTVP